MGFTSFLHLVDSTLTWATLASWFSLCPQRAPRLRDRLLNRHIQVGQSLSGPRVGLLTQVYAS